MDTDCGISPVHSKKNWSFAEYLKPTDNIIEPLFGTFTL